MFYAGFASRDITPGEPTWLGGFAARTKPSCGVHDRLYAKAAYLAVDGDNVVLISCDLLCFMQNQIDNIKKRIFALYGLQNISITATHTHSAPETRPRLADDACRLNHEWLAFVEDMIAEAVGEAFKAEEPVRLYGGMVSVPEVAKNRRAGETIVDDTLMVVRAENMSGEVKGCFINYPCHCTVLDSHNYLISADYPGFLYEKLQSRYSGAEVMFFNGACGNINIGYSADATALGADMGDIRTFENAERKADILFKYIEGAFSTATELAPEIVYKSITLQFPLKEDLPESEKVNESRAECARRISECADESEKTKLLIEKIYYTSLLENIQAYDTDGKSFIEGECAVIGLGDILIVTFPLELFCEIGLKIKELFRQDRRPAIFGYTNGYYGYLPTKAAHIAGGYECETSVHRVDSEDCLIDALRNIKPAL